VKVWAVTICRGEVQSIAHRNTPLSVNTDNVVDDAEDDDAEDDERAEMLEQIQDSLVASYILGVGGANVLV
jgi:hypothetical protein